MFNRLKIFKKNSRDILRERFVSILVATLLFISLTIGSLQILSLIALLIGGALSETASVALSVFAVVFWLLAFFPISYGYLSWMVGIFSGVNVEISDMFDVFSSAKSISRSFKIGGFCLVYIFSIILSVSYTFTFADEFFSLLTIELNNHVNELFTSFIAGFADFMAISVSLVFIIIWLIFLPEIVMSQYLYMTDSSLSISKAVRNASKIAKRKKLEFLILNFSFILWYILSFFTAGILFAAFLLPYHLFTVMGFLQYSVTQAKVTGAYNNLI